MKVYDVIQWFEGDEHPAVKFHNNCNYRMCDVCGGDADTKGIYYIKSGWDNIIVHDGDWIIDLDNGFYKVISDNWFKNSYEKVEE